MKHVIGFQKRFAELIRQCRKFQTIRKVWKRPVKVGDTLILYSGLRTKKCKLIGEFECLSVEGIGIDLGMVLMNGKVLSKDESNMVAEADGFTGATEMELWFVGKYGREFTGVLIKWR